jgi:hypothetical protein
MTGKGASTETYVSQGSRGLGASFEKQKEVFRKHDRQNEIRHLFGDYAMRRFRFHISTLVILVLLLGVGFAALRESNETWDGSIFSITLGIFLISILLAIHRSGSRRAFWLGFALFGSAYLGFSLVPSIESRLITTRALAYLDSKVPRSIPAELGYFEYGNNSMDLFVVNNSKPNALYVNKGNGWIKDVTAVAGSNSAGEQAWFPNILAGPIGTTENFIRIGHSLLALIAAFVGGQLSRYFFAKNREPVSGSVNPQNSPSNDS